MNSPEEAKYHRDKHIIEDFPNMSKENLAIAGVSSENFDRIKAEKQLGETKLKNLAKSVAPSKITYLKTKDILSKYLDTTNLNQDLLTTWILGTYFHEQFETYPLLIFMARKQSGKTRSLKLSSALSSGSDGSISTAITETSLFRHRTGAMFFDEMESISSKEKTALRETINSVYKRGNKIVRYIEKKVNGERQYVEECFYPFYPLGLANIYGFGDVLADRSLQIILQRSTKAQTKLIEDFSTNPHIVALRSELSNLNAEISKGIFSEWNYYVQNGVTTNDDLRNIFEAISQTKLCGRPLELFFPLFVVADLFGMLSRLIECSQEYMAQLEGEFVDNVDDLLQNFMESANYVGFVKLSKILLDFKKGMEQQEEWVNSKWLGRALKRLGLIEKKRLINGCVEVRINNNATNSTNPTHTTNSTNTTKKLVELVDIVDLDKTIDPKKCYICDKQAVLINKYQIPYCEFCYQEDYEEYLPKTIVVFDSLQGITRTNFLKKSILEVNNG
jgi:hypothetical protein